MSIVEVYNEQVRNLLRKSSERVEIMEDKQGKVKLVGVKRKKISTLSVAIQKLGKAQKNRKVGVTNINQYSSRSHS